jgi:heat-inducible transcriptional repressor
MADLCDAGFLEQPHTSAGRIPTTKAYRYYVEQISGQAHLSAADEGLIRQSLGGVTDPQEFMERTSHVLSLISSGVGVAVTGPGVFHALDHVYFSRLAEKKILAVVVTRSGVVRDRVLRVERDLPQSDLDTAARYINEEFRGWTIEAMRSEIARRMEQMRSEYDNLRSSLEELCRGGALNSPAPQSVFGEGVANLVLDQGDRERLKELLRALEEKERIVELLSAYLTARQEAVRVVIGLEEAMPQMRNLVLIGAPARVGNEVMGSLAVIGPTRMDYEHTITAVSYIAKMFDSILNENR